ncbi:class I SAM-dependent methyltransferase [Micromonospora sp. NPDC049559]|uniref:class I SAM-dependent methyltransferase n=1 Tax=Micromonospora sp. NPDC049559 TaxID=3155923 RepID=UPI00341692D0
MDRIPVTFTGVRVTALLELYLRWLDSKDPHPLLGDRWAGDVVERLDFDFSQFRSLAIGRFAVGLRSAVMDRRATGYLAEHPDAIVLDLGSGFDSRVFRVDPAPPHEWYDVDLPDVVEIADRLYPARPGHRRVGVSVLDPGWLAAIPGDRPAMVVADGFFGFFAPDEARQIIRSIVDHFPTGEIILNITSTASKRQRERRPVPLFTRFGIVEKWWIDDPREVEAFDERLRYVGDDNLLDPRLLRRSPWSYRLLSAAVRAVPAWRGQHGGILRYRF